MTTNATNDEQYPQKRRKTICRSCRYRKKRCDVAMYPFSKCSLCTKLDIRCEYIAQPPLPAPSSSSSASSSLSRGLGATPTTGTVRHLPRAPARLQPRPPPTTTAISTTAPPPTTTASNQFFGFLSPADSRIYERPTSIPDLVTEPHSQALDTAFVTALGEADFWSLETPELSFSGVVDGYSWQFDSVDQQQQQQQQEPTSIIPPTPPSLTETDLPPQAVLQELVGLFCDRFAHFLLCFHRPTLLAEIRDGATATLIDSGLIYAIMAIAAPIHPDPHVQSCQDGWMTKAKALYTVSSEANIISAQSTRSLQTAVCIMMLSVMKGEFAALLLMIGRVWRQICCNGLNRIDAQVPPGMAIGGTVKDQWEREVERRVVWVIFIFDRVMSFPSGWAHAIDDRSLIVNLPVEETVFQSADFSGMNSYDQSQQVRFTRHLNKLIATKPAHGLGSMQYLVKIHVILGRVCDYIYAVESDYDNDIEEQYLAEYHQLDSQLLKFRLSLPRKLTCISLCPAADRLYSIWVTAYLNCATILLHHPPKQHEASPKQSIANFQQCLTAAHNVVRLVEETTRIDPDLLINPLLSPPLFLCSRILTFEWRESKNEATLSDIGTLRLLFDRLVDEYSGYGGKFRNGSLFEFGLDDGRLQELRDEGARALFRECGKWSGGEGS